MTNVVELRLPKRTLENDLQEYIQIKLSDFASKTGLYPQDIRIDLVTFSRSDGSIDILVDSVEIKVAAVIDFQWQDERN